MKLKVLFLLNCESSKYIAKLFSLSIYAQSPRRIRSIVDELFVHCHRGCEFEPRHRTLFFCMCVFTILYFYQFIYLFKDIIHNYFQTIWVAEYSFNDSKQCIPY